jgi:hypothetical protein
MQKSFTTLMLLLCLVAPAAAAWPDQLAVYGVGARSTPNKHGQVSFESLNFEASGPTGRGFDFGLVLAPTLMRQPATFFDEPGAGDENVNAASLSLLIRHHFAERGAVRPYAELSSGPIWANKRVPETTSHFNFISQGGLGVVTTRTSVPIIVGIRFFHISNAGYAERNPGINFPSIVVGARFRR